MHDALYDLGGAEFSWLRSAKRGEWRWDGAGMKDLGDHHKKISLDPEGIRELLNYLKMDGHDHLCISCSWEEGLEG